MRVGSLLLGLALSLAAAAVPVHAAGCAGCPRVGAAAVMLRVPAGTPLAGYGDLWRRLLVPDLLGRHPHAFWFKPHTGALDGVHARALVVDGNGVRLVWIAADLIAVDRRFTERVAGRLRERGLAPGTLIVSASHTHSGPGAFLDSRVMAIVAVDREDPAVRDALVDGLVEAVRRAAAGARPARIGVASVAAPALTASRLDEPLDPEVLVLKVVSAAGAPLAVVWNYAIHGTMLGPRNLALSGDVMGLASREVERVLGVPALFVNGAVGDVSPAHHGQAAAETDARVLAAAIRTAFARARPAEAAALAVRSTRLPLGRPQLSARNCTTSFVPRRLTVPLGGLLPEDAPLVAVALGRTAWVTIPGELATRLGQAIKRSATPPWEHAFIAGVSNDYLGYFLAPGDYDRVRYVSCASLYGRDAGDRLAGAASALLGDLARGQGRER